jgi:putative PIN family toxin of toxin-antitoxin system
MRVVIDTNIFFSGLRGQGKPALVLDAIASPGFMLISSEDLLAELEDVISRKFDWTRERIESTLNRIRITAEMVSPRFELRDCADPDDNRILEAAVEGRADCIVSGDKRHLLRMKNFRGIEIMTAHDFLLRLESGASPRS